MNVITIAAATFCISVLTTIALATGNEQGTQTDPNKARLIIARTPQVPEKELSPRLKLTLMPIEELPLVVIHELWHVQQNYPKEDKTLLAGAINEGCCDFLTELVTGKTANEGLRKYGDDHEKQLWTEFRRDMMLGNKIDDWLYHEAKPHPADMGYYVGYRICKAYYEQASDKKAAVAEMLTIQNFPAFLKASKYQGTK